MIFPMRTLAICVATTVLSSSATALAADAPSYATAAALGAAELASSTGGCPDPKLATEAVSLSRTVQGSIIHYTSSNGACMGAVGEYQALAVKSVDGRWRVALAADPQSIKVGVPHGSGAATLSLYTVAGCTGTYTWTGNHFVEHRSVTGGVCGTGPFPAGLHVIERAMMERSGAAGAGDEGAPPVSEANPIEAVRTVIGHVETLPCWCDARFRSSAARYATSDLISAVEHGMQVAKSKGIDLWDGDLFTAQQNVRRARLMSAKVLRSSGDEAVVSARLSIDYADGSIYPPVDRTYVLKREGGAWKVDDFRVEGTPSVKSVFLHPERRA